MIKTSVPLADAVGKHISHFCSFDLGKQNLKNHCAHLVGHLLGYEFDNTCKNRTWNEKQRPEKGAAIRVNEIFNRCVDRDIWSSRPAHLSSCLLFVTHTSNMSSPGHQLVMDESSLKHIGIWVSGAVWHYSNTADKVVQDTEAAFIQTFRQAYHRPKQTVEFYYGAFL